ncbi:MAG: hypothetical protein J5706_04940 [Elusimicrobiales bacterium]|nr:hypothetical protein [Elusimicrobiales bacterium]
MKKINGFILLLSAMFVCGCTSENSTLASCGDDCVKLGRYPSEADGSPRDIEWIVLDREADGTMLLMSKYGLECMPYNEQHAAVTWETSTVRHWLNKEFFINAFTKEEQSKIVQTVIKNENNFGKFNERDLEYLKKWKAEESIIEGLKDILADDKNNYWNVPGGNDTVDNVWLLSLSDFQKYGLDKDESKRLMQPVPLLWEHYGDICSGLYDVCADLNVTQNYAWWLRSPGFMDFTAADVYYDGEIDDDGLNVENGLVAVRPVIRVKAK